MTYGFLILQLIMQIFVKSQMNNLWVMFFSLQIVCYFSIYDVPTPANVVIYVKQFKSLIQFDLLNPIAMAKIIDPEFNLKVFLLGSKPKVITNPDQKASIVNDMFLYIFFAIVAVVVGILLIIARIFLPFLKDKLAPKIAAYKKKMLWNGTIQTVNVSFFQTCISVGIQLKMVVRGSKYQEPLDFILMCVLTCYFMLLPFWVIYFVLRNRQKLHLPGWKERFGNLYTDIHLTKSKYTILYYPMTMVRRTVFVAIPTFLPNASWLQCQLVVMLSSFYLMWYLHVQPHNSRARIRLEACNEILIMLCVYHMMLFSKYVTNIIAQFYFGYSYIACIGLMLVGNMIRVVMISIASMKAKRMKKQNAKAAEKALVRKAAEA